jgi:hypothetical protein
MGVCVCWVFLDLVAEVSDFQFFGLSNSELEGPHNNVRECLRQHIVRELTLRLEEN